MTRKEFWFRWGLVIDSLGLSSKDLSGILCYPVSSYQYIVSNGSLPNKKTRKQWLNKLQIPIDIFDADLATFGTYLENKCQNTPNTPRNYFQSVRDLNDGLPGKNCMKPCSPRALMGAKYSDGILGQVSLNIWKKNQTGGKK